MNYLRKGFGRHGWGDRIAINNLLQRHLATSRKNTRKIGKDKRYTYVHTFHIHTTTACFLPTTNTQPTAIDLPLAKQASDAHWPSPSTRQPTQVRPTSSSRGRCQRYDCFMSTFTRVVSGQRLDPLRGPRTWYVFIFPSDLWYRQVCSQVRWVHGCLVGQMSVTRPVYCECDHLHRGGFQNRLASIASASIRRLVRHVEHSSSDTKKLCSVGFGARTRRQVSVTARHHVWNGSVKTMFVLLAPTRHGAS